MTAGEFPVGVTVDGRWRIATELRGTPDRGQYRADGDPPALVTLSSPHEGAVEDAAARLALRSPGVAPLLGTGRVVDGGAPYDALVEALPAGVTLDAWRGDGAAARRVALGLAEIVREAAHRGLVLAGIRPELVFVDGDRVTGVAPRGPAFQASAREPCYGVPPCFDDVYQAPEQLALRPPGPPADVFALGATLARLLTGRAPFGGASVLERLTAAMRGHHAPLDAAGALGPVLARAMSVEPAARPSIEALCAALRAGG